MTLDIMTFSIKSLFATHSIAIFGIKCHYAEFVIQFIVMLNAGSVNRLSVIGPSVVVPIVIASSSFSTSTLFEIYVECPGVCPQESFKPNARVFVIGKPLHKSQNDAFSSIWLVHGQTSAKGLKLVRVFNYRCGRAST